MKKKLSFLAVTFFSVILIAFAIISCQKSNTDATPSSVQNPSNVNTPESKAMNMSEPNYNLNVILRDVNQEEDHGKDWDHSHGDGRNDDRDDGRSLGHIKFRQDKDTPKIITLDVWVKGLEPNHSYQLQRAVDTNLDGNCTGTAWLTLGKGLTPQSILTDDRGRGQEDLWRDVSAIASGSTFDIHFQIVDEVTLAVVLSSDCYQYTVR